MCKDDEDISLERGCELLVDLTKNMGSKTVESVKPSWLSAAKEAAERFESNLVAFALSWAKDCWKIGGPDEVAATLESCKFIPPKLQPLLTLAKNASIMDALQPVELKLEDLEKELPALVKPAKKWIMTLGMDKDMVREFFGDEKADQLTTFSESVVAALGKVLNCASGLQKIILGTVKEYRSLPGLTSKIQIKKPES